MIFDESTLKKTLLVEADHREGKNRNKKRIPLEGKAHTLHILWIFSPTGIISILLKKTVILGNLSMFHGIGGGHRVMH